MDDVPRWLLDVALVAGLIVGLVGAAALAVVEVSLLRVRPSQVRVAAAEGNRRAARLLRLLGDLPVVLNTVLFTVLLGQVGVASISGFLAQRWFGGFWIPATSVVVSLVLFVYAESLPKTLAVASPYERALRSAGPLSALVRVFRPVVTTLVSFVNRHVPRGETRADVVSERELRLLARQAAQAGVIGVADADLVDRSFHFGDQRVADVMVTRDDIVAVALDLPVAAALSVALEASHRRLPVFDRNLDDVVGVVRMRDLVVAQGAGDNQLATPMRPPLFCSPDDSIAQLIERMRSSGLWLAIVRDAAGTTVGLATVEDIVAELAGEIEEPPPTAMPRQRGAPGNT